MVEPTRTESGTRTYSADDVTRLMMIKQLVDTGDAIGVVATLSSAQLQALVAATSAAPSRPAIVGPCRVVVIGRPLATRLSDAKSELEDIEVVGTVDSPDQITRWDDKPSPDVLILELPALSSTSPQDVMNWLDRSGAYHAIVLYRFGHADALNGFRTHRICDPATPLSGGIAATRNAHYPCVATGSVNGRPCAATTIR